MKRILSFVFCVLLMSVIFAEASISDKNDKLIQAAEKGNLQEVQSALAEGADINAIKRCNGFDSGIRKRSEGSCQISFE